MYNTWEQYSLYPIRYFNNKPCNIYIKFPYFSPVKTEHIFFGLCFNYFRVTTAIFGSRLSWKKRKLPVEKSYINMSCAKMISSHLKYSYVETFFLQKQAIHVFVMVKILQLIFQHKKNEKEKNCLLDAICQLKVSSTFFSNHGFVKSCNLCLYLSMMI